MTTSKKTSIIIPNYNGATLLRTCFDALKAQTYPHIEVILVDDGSTDDSVAMTICDYPWISIIQQPRNMGFIKAINQGIANATGDIIISLNNDTAADPKWVEALVQALDTYPQAGMAASKLRLFDQQTVLHSAGDAFGVDGIPINRGVWQEDKGQYDNDTFVFGCCGGAVAFTRAMLDDVGLFDEDLFMYCEDVDLNWRAQLAGYRCIFVPDAIVYHHLSATGGGTLASYYTGRNTILVLAKSVPGVVFRNHFLEIIKAQLRISIDALRAWRGEAARARLRGQLAGLLGIPKWLLKRRQIQKTQSVSDNYLEALLEKNH